MDEGQRFLSDEKHPLSDEQQMAEAPTGIPMRPDTRSSRIPVVGCGNDIPKAPESGDCQQCLAAVTHRLAQPLTALRGGLELALIGERSLSDYRRLIEQSMQLADDMAALIISLRDLAEACTCTGKAQSLRLESIATEVVAEMQPLAQLRDLRMELCTHQAVKICVVPERLREALQSLLAWIIQNSAGGGVMSAGISTLGGEAQLLLSPPRMDLQYLQIKVLQDTLNPGLLFSHAAKNGALGWAISQRLMEGLGAKLEILTDGPDPGTIRVRFPLARDH